MRKYNVEIFIKQPDQGPISSKWWSWDINLKDASIVQMINPYFILPLPW